MINALHAASIVVCQKWCKRRYLIFYSHRQPHILGLNAYWTFYFHLNFNPFFLNFIPLSMIIKSSYLILVVECKNWKQFRKNVPQNNHVKNLQNLCRNAPWFRYSFFFCLFYEISNWCCDYELFWKCSCRLVVGVSWNGKGPKRPNPFVTKFSLLELRRLSQQIISYPTIFIHFIQKFDWFKLLWKKDKRKLYDAMIWRKRMILCRKTFVHEDHFSSF